MTQDLKDIPLDGVMENYVATFLSGDSWAYADLWTYPMSYWAGGRWWAYPDAEACAKSNDAYYAMAREEGMATMRVAGQSINRLDERSAIVETGFERARADGTIYRRSRNTYVVIRTEDGWKLAVALIHPAEELG